MPLRPEETSLVQTTLERLVGQPVWGARLGHGSFITVELGASIAVPPPKKYLRGEFHLWVFCCAWQIEKDGELLAACQDPRDALAAAIPTHLDGRTVAAARTTATGVDLELVLDDGVILRTFALHSGDYEHWMLFLPDGNVLEAGPGIRFELVPGDEPRS